MKQFIRYFLQGLILFIPLIITLFIISRLFSFFSGLFSLFGFSDNVFLNTFFGFTITIGFIAITGVLASSFIFKQFFNFIENKLEHAPFIRHIYSPIKDFTNAFVGNKKRFNKPVLVLTNVDANIEEIGFITQENLKDFNLKDKVSVYIPMSYSLSGRLIIVPITNIKSLNTDAADTMKFVVSGGVTDIED